MAQVNLCDMKSKHKVLFITLVFSLSSISFNYVIIFPNSACMYVEMMPKVLSPTPTSLSCPIYFTTTLHR